MHMLMMRYSEIIRKFKPFFFNLVLIWLAVLFYRTNDYYVDFLSKDTQMAIFYLAIVYSVFGFFYLLYIGGFEKTKGTIVFNMLKKMVRDLCLFVCSPSLKNIPGSHQRG